ncbi:unnamed protein product [marine sediment metagenome]|uniref:Uncharacterized protein n=1 Tax=marine sediment metagenome TaxID=412755 RepID=X0S0W4_9ZZZZ
MYVNGKRGFLRSYGEVDTKTTVKDGNWGRRADAHDHELHREHWTRQKMAKRKLRRLQMMLEMKRLQESLEL